MTILHTPATIRHLFYFGFDRRAQVGDEMLAVSVGRLYLGLYPTEQGMEICWGVLDQNEAL